MVLLVKPNGEVSSIREYDASGQMLGQAPHDRDPFGFTGGLGSGDGLWKLGARFYDSKKNSFIQQDRYMGDPSDPLSLNRYVYCNLDPVNYNDPTGFCGIFLPGKPPLQMLLEGGIKWAHQKSYSVLEGIFQVLHNSLYSSHSIPPNMKLGIMIVLGGLGLPNGISFDSKQLGQKWGKHRSDYPDLKSHKEYMNLADDTFNNAENIIFDSKANEFYFTRGNDLLRLGPDGSFICLYPGATSSRVGSASGGW